MDVIFPDNLHVIFQEKNNSDVLHRDVVNLFDFSAGQFIGKALPVCNRTVYALCFLSGNAAGTLEGAVSFTFSGGYIFTRKAEDKAPF